MRNQVLLLSIGMAFGISYSASAQDSFDPDVLLVDARTLILERSYFEGREIAFKALAKYPNYADILILVGRSYAWEGKNDSASIYLERAIVASPAYEDGYSAYLDNLTWSGAYLEGFKVLDRAKANFGTAFPPELAYRESRLYYYQEDYDAAYAIAEELFKKEFKKEGFLGYIQNLQRYRRTNAVGMTYDYDTYFDDISPWNTFSLYGRTRTKLTGALIARVTHAYRFDGSGTLFELDAYPSLGKNAYAYINVGGSGASFFPNYRFGTSIYYNLPKAWEIDAGFRYLKFSEATTIYTGSIGKYVGNWWINFRFNVIPQDTGAGTSGNIQARYYFKTAEDFFSVQISSGISPDEESRDPSQLLNSYRAGLGYQQLISPRVMIFGYTGYSRNELSTDRFRKNLNISIGAEYRF